MDYIPDSKISDLNKLVKSRLGIAAFIGAGCSAVLKIPLWDDMLIRLNEEFKFYSTSLELKDDLKRIGYPQVASNIKSKAPDDKTYKDLIVKFVRPSACHFTSLHVEIVRASKLILTTNYDRSFEETYDSLLRFDNGSGVSYTSSSLGGFDHFGWGTQRHIFHLHGEATTGEVVLTYESYEEQYKNPHSGVANLINPIFSQFSTLFVGFSFEDQFFTKFLKESFQNIKAEKLRFGQPFPTHYCILSDKLKKEFITAEELLTNNINIDDLISSKLINEDRTSVPGQTVFKFASDAINILNRTTIDTKGKTFIGAKVKQIASNKEKIQLLAQLEIEVIYFEHDEYLQIEYILREINKQLPGISLAFIPN